MIIIMTTYENVILKTKKKISIVETLTTVIVTVVITIKKQTVII